MILRGRIIADCVVTKGRRPAATRWARARRRRPNPVATRPRSGATTTSTPSSSATRPASTGAQPGDEDDLGERRLHLPRLEDDVHGNAATPSPSDRTADGEDEITVWYLQSMDVVTSPTGDCSRGSRRRPHAHPRRPGRHRLLRDLHDRQPRRSPQLRRSTCSTPAPRTTASTSSRSTATTTTRTSTATSPGNDANGGATTSSCCGRSKCIDNESPFALNAGVPSTCATPTEKADHPAFVALLAGNDDPDGGIGLYRDRTAGQRAERPRPADQLRPRAQRPAHASSASAATTRSTSTTRRRSITLDGGAGYDLFQIGQIFGTQRDSEPRPTAARCCRPTRSRRSSPTTRGWLSPGTHAPLVATGGTGNDEFVVYSNQAEIRLEGDDDNDLFIVRAFAIAAVCDTNADSDGRLRPRRRRPRRRPDTSCSRRNGSGSTTVAGVIAMTRHDVRARRPATSATTTTATASATTPTRTSRTTTTHGSNVDLDNTMWEDDVIPLDANGVAVPVIGLGFSTDRPLDIRAGGGEDEVQYNVNAPVYVDGGTGFDKLVVLGTEFADDFVITDKAIYGAGLNVKYTTIEVARGRRARGRRPVLRPLDRVRRRLPRHRRPRLRPDQRRRRRDRRHRDARARGPLRRRRPHRHVRSTRATTASSSTACRTTSRRRTPASS